MKCPICETVVPEFLRHCPACEADVGFPNVRAAAELQNVEALKKRFDEANISARARNCEAKLKEFGKRVASSKAIICLNFGIARRVLESDNQLIATYYQQVDSMHRLPENNDWDKVRESVEARLFPNYYRNIHFASLSLQDSILDHYGNCGLILNEKAIKERTTVFEKNPTLFFEEFGITIKSSIPKGYRAVWAKRDMLAIAKLHPKLSESTDSAEYSRILNNQNAGDGEDDFVEAHIFGSLHRRSVERVIVKEPRKKAEKVLLKSLQKSLQKSNVSLEVIS